MKKPTILMVGIVASMLFSSGAAADQRTVPDPKEYGTFLDVASVSHDHSQRPDGSWRFHHTITMYDNWKSKRLCETSTIWINFKDTERAVVIFWKKGLRARVYNMAREHNNTIGHPAVWRSDTKSVDVAIRPRLLGSIGGDYRYKVSTGSSSCTCGDVASCAGFLDKAPDRRYIRHVL